ncbi:SDR family NAD(P)-dependent oxidoreductase [Cellulomonas bogoriensis]|uniref:Oxidoreductase n=1 Tax=Cellulomonas bogoriensis 69B4 = DSM 16987 TaxID=1386082 RepID=A0A0A0BZT2_9CELL|nr:SDR family NAD(P)-dependent oxidoreductase [Cellulomonas bogoriensis]KGM13187.1 oxidoreductase [Cellulomonas bogoriensis 69B4 = DSM 16987]
MTSLDHSTQTTIVTGASSGIGAALARRLAARGSDLVLVARRVDRLEHLAAELRSAHGTRVEVVGLDLAAPHPGATLAAELDRRGVRVTSLVNNAGFGTDGAFADDDPEQLASLVAVNVGAVVDLTRAFVGQLSAAGTGYLVNIASVAAYQPIPGMAVYAASKAFVLSFTEALWWELRGTGVRTLVFSPGLTSTEFFDQIGTAQYGDDFQSPEQVADAVLRSLDGRRAGPSTTARRRDALAAAVVRLLSRRAAVVAAARFAGADRLMDRGSLLAGVGR